MTDGLAPGDVAITMICQIIIEVSAIFVSENKNFQK